MSQSVPQVSILLSAYNAAKTLDRCFESIRAQTFQDYHIVCINDCSTDDTGKRLKEWQEKFSPARFTLITNPANLGVTKSLNKGLALIRSSYTARLDVDDWWHPDKLEKQVNFLENHPDYGIVGTAYLNVSGTKEQVVRLWETDAEIKRHLLRRNPFAHSAVMFRTALITGLGSYNTDIRYGQDFELWLRAAPSTKFHNLPEVLCFRSVGTGISVDYQRTQMWNGIKTQVRYIRKHHLPWSAYANVLELLALIITPDWVKKIKRRFFS